jgi:hyaluronate lyase
MRARFVCLILGLLPAAGMADPFDDLRTRWQQTLTGGAALDTTIPQVRSNLNSINSTARRYWSSLQSNNGRTSLWTDIASTTISADISSNYSRLHALATAWATPGQPLYQDSGLLADLRSALNWMDANRYNSRVPREYDNWWDWEIGSPALLADIAILLYDQLSTDELARFMAAIERFDSNPAIMIVNTVSTGANLADKCKIALLRGILVKDANKIALAVNDLSPVFAYVTSGDGFYADGSFIQHTRHPYTGSYGLVLLGDIAQLLYLLNGSPFDVTDPGRANLLSWVNNSFSPLIYEGAMMDMSRGRAVSRYSSTDHVIGHSVIAALLRITQFAAADDASALRSSIKRWLQDDTTRDFSTQLPLDLIGEANRVLKDNSMVPADLPSASHVYASMDRVVHLRPTWAAAIAMHSSRIYNYESINNENLRGWHTGDGMTYLYNGDLTQFSDSFWPTVDPQRLPGTTVIAGSTARQSQTGGSNAVGGASIDGYSAVMLQLVPDGRQLSAKKSWFLFDNELAALGADISSSAAGKTVETIIENRRVTGDPTFTADPNGAWANFAGIGYYFPNGSVGHTLAETRSGAWRDINAGGPTTILSTLYRTMWFDHGVAPSGAGYAYVVLPGMGPDDTAAYSSSPAIQIVENDAGVQAVIQLSLGIQAANFWSGNGASAAGITCDSVASVLAHQTAGQINIAVSDPTQANNGTIHVEVAASASAALSVDDGITVDQLNPTIRLSVNVKNGAGKSFRVSLAR